MTANGDGNGDDPRHRPNLRPVPPEDPYQDPTPPANHDAEQALLATLIHHPELTPDLRNHLDASDFYWPTHATLWDTIHHLVDADTGLDPILLNDHLVKTKEPDAARLLPDLLTLEAIPGNATHYATLIRDQARLRAVDQVATRLRQVATRRDPDNITTAMETAVETLDHAFNRFGPTPGHTPAFVDLSWILNGDPPPQPQPTWARRTDGTALFYPGKVNGIFGDPEAAKTWLAQVAVIEALNSGGTAAMIDADHNGPNHTAARLCLLGARLEHLADPNRFRYYEPEDATELHASIDDIVRHAPDVLVVDSIGEIFPILGVNSNDPDEVSTAMRLVGTRPADAGSCVITIDHLPKGTDARASGFAIGATAKKRMIRGAYLRAEARTQPAPGSIGRITLRIEKDTSGTLRRTSNGGYAGTFTLDSTHSETHGTTTWTIGREDSPITTDGKFRPTHLMEKVSRYVEQNDQATFREIKDVAKSSTKNVKAAVECLVNEGYMSTIPGPNRSTLHHSNSMYREDEDDQN